MTKAVTIKNDRIQSDEMREANLIWIGMNKNKTNMGTNAGKSTNESAVFPFAILTNARCVPHPGHSIPVVAFHIQGKRCSSEKCMDWII